MEPNQQNIQVSKIDQRHGNKEQTDSDQRGGGREVTGKEGEGSSQGTCIKKPWTRTTRGRIECRRRGVGRAGESNGGKWGQP